MRMHSVVATSGLLLCVALQSGCALWRGEAAPALASGAGATSAASGADQSREAGDLPKDQTIALCLTTAERLAGEGHAREACLLYLKARNLAPRAAEYPRRLAPLYAQLDDLPNATQQYETALAAAPSDAELWNDWGCFLLRRGDLPQAEQKLRQALTVDPNHARAKSNLALVCARTERQGEAFELFAGVVGPAAAHSNLGVLLAKQGRDEEARRAFATAQSLDPTLRQPALFLEQFERLAAEATPP